MEAVSSKKKILFLCQQVQSDPNRAQFNRVRFLCKHFSVFIIAIGPVSVKTSRQAAGVYRFPLKGGVFRILAPFWSIWKTMVVCAIQRDVDCIHTTYEPRNLIIGYLLSRLLNIKWTADLWDDPAKSSMMATLPRQSGWRRLIVWGKQFEFNLARRCLPHADKVIIGMVPDSIADRYKLAGTKILAVTNGINLNLDFKHYRKKENDADKIKSYSDVFTIFYCGGVDKIRLEGLNPCMRILLDKIPAIRLVVVGPQVTRNAHLWLRQVLEGLGSRLLFEVQDRQPYTKVLAQIASSNICICPYPNKLDLATAYPVKILDFMAMGKPVVASHLPGISRLITHGVDGLLFPPGNYREMAYCILQLYDSPSLCAWISHNAIQNVNKFSWETIHNRMYDFLER